MESKEDKKKKIIECVKKNKEMSISDISRETKLPYYAIKMDIIPELVKEGALEYVDKGNSYQYLKLVKKK